MGSIKIIHILKNDNFEDVFDLFKKTEAREVVFVFPRGSKFAKQEKYFTAIKREADSSDKHVSIMATDQAIIQFATQNDLEILESPSPRKRQTEAPAMVSDIRKPREEMTDEVEAHTEDNGLVAQLTTAKKANQPRVIKDIFRPETDKPVKIKNSDTRPFKIDVRREISESENVGGDITQVWASRESADNKNIRPTTATKKNRIFSVSQKTTLFFAAGAIIVLLLILYSALGSAQIVISPQKIPLSFQIKASALSSATEINFDFNRLPGQRFGYKDELSGSFPAGGIKEVVQKASGKITIYNKGASSQRLVATTRFKSPTGLIYRIPQTIEIPPATGTGASLKEGSIESLVYAEKAGAEYNIGSSTFTIPGFEGNPKFDDFYAKSDQPMTGGIVGPSNVITEEDFFKAQSEITAKLKEKILRSLKDQAGELKILESTEIKFDAPITNAKVGEAAETLNMTIKGTAGTMAFRESDVLELVRNYVAKKDGSELMEKNLTINYLNPQNNADGLAMSFEIKVTGQSAVKINLDKILKDLPGMREDAIRDYFKNIKEIESARVTLSPFWVKSIPKNPDKIKLTASKD